MSLLCYQNIIPHSVYITLNSVYVHVKQMSTSLPSVLPRKPSGVRVMVLKGQQELSDGVPNKSGKGTLLSKNVVLAKTCVSIFCICFL